MPNLTTFRELFDLYYTRHALVKIKCPENVRYWGTTYGPKWFPREIADICKDDIQDWVDEVGVHSQSASNRAATTLAAIFAWGIKRGYCTVNPCIGIEKFRAISRDRFLLPGELQSLKLALSKQPLIIHDLMWVALLTAARKANVLSMRWDEIDLDLKVWRIPGKKFKSGTTHLIPLEGDVLDILIRRRNNSFSPWVFPGKAGQHFKDPKRAWTRIKKQAGIKDFWFHDLRRTVGSYMAINGASQYVIGKALGHKDQRSTAVYARLDLDTIRTAFQAVHLTLSPDQRV